MVKDSQIIQKVDAIYQWLEGELAHLFQSCQACGNCCDFESFGHRLYITTPELLYFEHHAVSPIKVMNAGVCPYRIDGKCSVYPYRFVGCRIFTCQGDAEKESKMCEQAIKKLKALCDGHEIDYHYVCLKTGLEMLNDDPQFKIKN